MDEFVAELSNPALSQSLKSGGFFERIIDAIAQFFGIAGISKNSQARKALYDLLDTAPKGKSEGVMYKMGDVFSNVKKKFGFDDKKTADLLEWHKDSHPLTKEADGTPKVFYHGTSRYDETPFEIFEPNSMDFERPSIYFSSSKKIAETYKLWDDDKVFEVFLNFKNPKIIDFKGETYGEKGASELIKQAEADGIDGFDAVIFKNINGDTRYYTNEGVADTILVFDSKQIKEVSNRGKDGRYFDGENPNIYYKERAESASVKDGRISPKTQKDGVVKNNEILKNFLDAEIKSGKIPPLPKPDFTNYNEFKAKFENVKNNFGEITTPIGTMSVRIPYAWRHFSNNSKKVNRENIKGGFFETFKNPSFVVRHKQKKRETPSVYFYKSFYDVKNNKIDLIGISPNGDEPIFSTFYKDDGDRIVGFLNDKNIEILYIKETP